MRGYFELIIYHPEKKHARIMINYVEDYFEEEYYQGGIENYPDYVCLKNYYYNPIKNKRTQKKNINFHTHILYAKMKMKIKKRFLFKKKITYK